MKGDILVLNSGSSSIKFGIYDGDLPELPLISHGQITGIGRKVSNGGKVHLCAFHSPDGEVIVDEKLDSDLNHNEAMGKLIDWGREGELARDIQALGHRVVHGGVFYKDAVRVNTEVVKNLQTLIPVAPLHQVHDLAGIHALHKLMPSLPQVACFDTSFHHTLPKLAQEFALPKKYFEQGIRRYGFHGLSYESIAQRLNKIAGPKVAGGKVIVAHLGNGASLCALDNGRSIDTTMGFTALDGLPMGTRCGYVDPGIVLYMQNELGMSAPQVSDLLYKESGLLGVSGGISNNMSDLLESDQPSAKEAIDLFVYRINREIGALFASLKGLDALVFTAGIGENSDEIRKQICELATWLDIEIDQQANQRHELCISTKESKISVWVIPTNEESIIAQHTREVIDNDA